MIKLNKLGVYLVLLMAVFVVSCQNSDDVDKSIVTSFEKFTFSELPAALVVPEADETYSFSFAFDEKQIMNVTVDITSSDESTATEGSDFDLSTDQISVSALERSGEFEISVHSDFEPEGDETVILSFTPHDPHGLPLPAESLVLTIRDSIYPVAVRVDWEGPFVYAGTTYHFCSDSDVDIDFWLEDAAGDVVDGYQGATGACPENSFLDGIGDGVYTIIADLYGNGLFGIPNIDTIPIPTVVSIYKGGVVSGANTTVKYATADYSQIPVWTSYTDDSPGLVAFGTIRIGGGKVTLVDPDGADVGSLNQ